jgi:hypothetical protein
MEDVFKVKPLFMIDVPVPRASEVLLASDFRYSILQGRNQFLSLLFGTADDQGAERISV